VAFATPSSFARLGKRTPRLLRKQLYHLSVTPGDWQQLGATLFSSVPGGGGANARKPVTSFQGYLKIPIMTLVASLKSRRFISLDCNGCATESVGAALTNPNWIYGSDDDTLFLIA